MKTLFILNDGPYGSERSCNGRLAMSLLKREGEEVRGPRLEALGVEALDVLRAELRERQLRDRVGVDASELP